MQLIPPHMKRPWSRLSHVLGIWTNSSTNMQTKHRIVIGPKIVGLMSSLTLPPSQLFRKAANSNMHHSLSGILNLEMMPKCHSYLVQTWFKRLPLNVCDIPKNKHRLGILQESTDVDNSLQSQRLISLMYANLVQENQTTRTAQDQHNGGHQHAGATAPWSKDVSPIHFSHRSSFIARQHSQATEGHHHKREEASSQPEPEVKLFASINFILILLAWFGKSFAQLGTMWMLDQDVTSFDIRWKPTSSLATTYSNHWLWSTSYSNNVVNIAI